MNEEFLLVFFGGLIGLITGLLTTLLSVWQSQNELAREEQRHREELAREEQRRIQDIARHDRLHETSVIAEEMRFMSERYRLLPDVPEHQQEKRDLLREIGRYQKIRRRYLEEIDYLKPILSP